MNTRQRVAVVTGGGGGIGAAIAEELGRGGWFVVTVDPMVTLDGSEQLPEPQETTAGRIVAAGGAARTSSVSVTDGEAVRALFRELVDEHGALDAVINVAGITRQTGFAHGTEEDWLAVLTVHLQGYLNILAGALPLMAAAGRGRIVGVTSGSGWRPADAGAYSCAKRVVAALTWQLGRVAPAGVTVNAMSPIAATRMVAAAIERAREAARAGGRTGSGGGLSLFSMGGPEALGPFGAHLVGDDFGWCTGQVLFAGGSEVAVVAQPHVLEVVRTDEVPSLNRVLDAVIPRALATAEANQASDGAGNPRFGSIFDEAETKASPGTIEEGGAASSARPTGPVRSCLVVSDRPELTSSVVASLESRSITCQSAPITRGFDDAARVLRSAVEASGPVDAIVVAPAGRAPAEPGEGWARILAEHQGIVEDLHADAGWARAVADYAAEVADADHPVTVVTLVDATTAGGRSRAQAAIQLARAAAGATERRVRAFAVSVEAPDGLGGTDAPRRAERPDSVGRGVAELTAHLLTNPDAATLAGAELVVAGGWLGLRSHPRAGGSVTFGGPAVPAWLDDTLREIVGVTG